jgi:Uncharacterized protein conserved in bacteria (DUF2252)
MSPIQALRTVLAYLDRYRATVLESARTRQVGEVALGTGRGPTWDLLGRTTRGDQLELLERLTKTDKAGDRRIRRDVGKYPATGAKKAALLREKIEHYGRQTGRPEAYRVLDVAGRVVGIGSLGLRHYAVLIAGGDRRIRIGCWTSRKRVPRRCEVAPTRPNPRPGATAPGGSWRPSVGSRRGPRRGWIPWRSMAERTGCGN